MRLLKELGYVITCVTITNNITCVIILYYTPNVKSPIGRGVIT